MTIEHGGVHVVRMSRAMCCVHEYAHLFYIVYVGNIIETLHVYTCVVPIPLGM